MAEAAVVRPSAVAAVRDVVELAKPRITAMVVLTAGVGLEMAPVAAGPLRAGALVVGTTLLVASANIFNSWIERDIDARMVRTRHRPLPSGRVDPWTAFALALALGAFAIPILAIAVNPLTALLGAVAHGLYVLVYTPLKRVTPRALEIGAVPGAIPPLMGWTAATGSLAAPGWVLFGILFFWQLPHFVAIAVYLEDDYRRGGLRVLPAVRGLASARRHLLVSTALLVAVSVAAWSLGMAGWAYLAVAVALGAGFVAAAVRGVARAGAGAWARRTMLYSLVYLVVLVGALVLDAR